ncbi:hypothetical protein GCM10020366_11260 [Saccharopolyspora gregorii]|uniref:Uncharacterized protein n=1 Tax=Saccharopolyspora gregorii TaxID=33914 RepID=A0ABP6RIR6_9PSEU
MLVHASTIEDMHDDLSRLSYLRRRMIKAMPAKPISAVELGFRDCCVSHVNIGIVAVAFAKLPPCRKPAVSKVSDTGDASVCELVTLNPPA